MNDCKTCVHAEVLYTRTKDGRFAAAYASIDYVRCSGPRYKGRAYFCKASRKACTEYEKRDRTLKDAGGDGAPYADLPMLIPAA